MHCVVTPCPILLYLLYVMVSVFQIAKKLLCQTKNKVDFLGISFLKMECIQLSPKKHIDMKIESEIICLSRGNRALF